MENNYLPRLLTVVSRISADTHCSGRVRNIGTKNLYLSRLIIILNRTKGYIHGLCLRRAHTKSDTPNNNSLHTTLQKALHSHRHTYTPVKTHTEIYQVATWTLKSGIFIPHIHITGMCIGPDPLLPNSEINHLYATLITDFHPPSSPSSQHTHGGHYHIYTGDFNSWTGTALEDHLAHPPSQFPPRVGDPRLDHQPQDRTPNPQARTTNPKARGRLLLDFLNPHSLIIGNGRFQNNQQPYVPTTKHNTTSDYFIFSRIIMPDIQSCTAHPNSWHRLPSPPPPSTSPNPKHTSRTDHNILSLHLLLPAHPPLQSAHLPKTHFPPIQTFHAWKLKHSDIKVIFQKDLEVTAPDILPQLQALLDNTTHQTSQQRVDAACRLVQNALHNTASTVLSSPSHTNTRTNAHISKLPANPKQAHQNPTTTATGLRLEIQKLKNTIATRKKENSHNPELLLLNKLCNQKKKEQIIDYKKQNSALLHKHTHEIKVTPFNATMNTAWQLLHDYKSNEAAGKSQLP